MILFYFLKCCNRWIFHLSLSCKLPLYYFTVKSPEVTRTGSSRTTLLPVGKINQTTKQLIVEISNLKSCICGIPVEVPLHSKNSNSFLFNVFYSYFQSLLHMNQKATFIFILYEAKSSASQNLRAAQVGFFCQCVRVHTADIHNIYLQYIYLMYKVH